MCVNVFKDVFFRTQGVFRFLFQLYENPRQFVVQTKWAMWIRFHLGTAESLDLIVASKRDVSHCGTTRACFEPLFSWVPYPVFSILFLGNSSGLCPRAALPKVHIIWALTLPLSNFHLEHLGPGQVPLTDATLTALVLWRRSVLLWWMRSCLCRDYPHATALEMAIVDSESIRNAREKA